MFFPAAALHAALVLPWSVLIMTGAPGPAALSTPFGHAHEMLLGYALAVVAGYQLPRLAATRLWLLFALWLFARAQFVSLPYAVGWELPNAAFALAVVGYAAPRLLRAARKARNRALPALLMALCGIAAAYAITPPGGAIASRALVTATVLLLAGLMLFMGGRMLAAAAAGAFYRHGRSLGARVQPALESAILAAVAIAALAALLQIDLATRLGAAVAGILAAVRLLRWQLWRTADRMDLMRLGAGYAWLAVGLVGIAASDHGSRIAALHVITIGALGTLSLNVMANVAAARSRAGHARETVLTAGTMLIGAATLCRMAAVWMPGHDARWLHAAAACWSVAFFGLLGLLVLERTVRARQDVESMR